MVKLCDLCDKDPVYTPPHKVDGEDDKMCKQCHDNYCLSCDVVVTVPEKITIDLTKFDKRGLREIMWNYRGQYGDEKTWAELFNSLVQIAIDQGFWD